MSTTFGQSRAWFAAMLVATTVLIGRLEAKIVYVTQTGSNGNNGLSWASSKASVTSALMVAAAGDEIWVAAGTYVERFTLPSGIRLYGGFAGGETQLSQRDWASQVTTLDGSAGSSVVTIATGATSDTRIDGFTIRNGAGTSLASDDGNRYGGAIYCVSGAPVIANNRLMGNTASAGAGIACDSAAPTILNTTLQGNTASRGAGVYCKQSTPVILNCTFAENTGTGIYCEAASATIANNIFRSNSDSGVYCYSASPAITNNTFVSGNARQGAGIACMSASAPNITNNLVAFNASGIYNWNSSPQLHRNCVFNPGGPNYQGLDPGAEDISMDPLLPWLPAGDAHLQAGSPCIDAGADAAVSPTWTDLDGRIRVYGGHVDIGADEFDGTAPVPGWTIVRVRPTGDDANPGSSWALAKRTVQAGIDAAMAASGGEVWVAAGTYVERIELKLRTHVYGGFSGAELARDERDWVTNVTVLDGNAGGTVVLAKAPGFGTSTIDGFTIRNGAATSSANSYGGGVYCFGSSPTIANNTITANSAKSGGGGIHCSNSSAQIANSRIIGNRVLDGSGGGINCSSAPVVIANNVIAGNSVTGTLSGAGAIHASSSSGGVTIRNNTIAGNSAEKGAGGINVYSSSAVLLNNIVAYNNRCGINSGSGTPLLRNNCVYNPGATEYSGVSPGEGDFSADPQLVAAEYGEFHLSAASPCIDAGYDAAVTALELDMDGQARTVGTHADVGADEFNGAAPTETRRIVRVRLAGDDAQDGSSWALAKRTVQAGIEAAAAAGGGEVWVAAGSYAQTSTLRLKSWVHVYGGFAGTETQHGERDWVAYRTELKGSGATSIVTAECPGYHWCTIDGFTIRNGSGTVVSGYMLYGGGIYCKGSSPTISHNTITGNNMMGTYARGAAISGESSSARIVNNTIVGNYGASTIGGIEGVIFAYESSFEIFNNIIAFNSAGLSLYSSACTSGHNCIYNPGGFNGISLGSEAGNLFVDPGLTAMEYGDYRLAANSPCIDAGLDSAVPSGAMEVGGGPRILGAHVDLGAEEFKGTPAVFMPPVVHVRPTGNDASSGLSWALAKRTVQAGISAAAALGGGDVWVAAGTYHERINLSQYVHVFGGFAGSESTREARDWGANPTVLDGDAGGSVVTVSGLSHLATTIDGFTIRNGRGTVSGDSRRGGGIYCYYASPAIRNNRIVDNKVTGSMNCSGGGISGTYSSAVISDNTLEGNSVEGSSSGFGAGIACGNGTLTITNNTIRGNTATGGVAAYGGGIVGGTATLLIANNTITGNTISASTQGYGGGIRCDDCKVIIRDNAITENSVSTNTYAYGGGIYVNSLASSSTTLVNNTIAGNEASGATYGRGGGLYYSGPTNIIATVANNTIARNTGHGVGGGAYFSGGTTHFYSNILAFNSSGLEGQYGNLTLRNNCLYNPAGEDYTGVTAGSGDVFAPPLFMDDANGDYRLAPDSPCIDAGYNLGVPDGILADASGQPRFIDDWTTPDCRWAPGTCGPAPIVDIGAHEFVPAIPGDFNGDGFVVADEVAALRACISGPAVAASPECTGGDLDRDGDVDASDFGILQRCFSGPDVPAMLNCWR